MTITVCFSCCHRWNWIFWSRGLPDGCLLRSRLPLQVRFFIMQFCFNFDQTDNQKRVNFSHLFKVYEVHVFYRQSKMFAGFTLAQVVSTWSWIRAPVLKSLLTFWIVTIKSRRYVRLDHPTTRTTVTSSPLIT